MTAFYDTVQILTNNFTVFRFLRLTLTNLVTVEIESRHKNTPLLDIE